MVVFDLEVCNNIFIKASTAVCAINSVRIMSTLFRLGPNGQELAVWDFPHFWYQTTGLAEIYPRRSGMNYLPYHTLHTIKTTVDALNVQNFLLSDIYLCLYRAHLLQQLLPQGRGFRHFMYGAGLLLKEVNMWKIKVVLFAAQLNARVFFFFSEYLF